MNKQLSQRGFIRLWAIQLTVTFLLVLLFAITSNTNAAISALLGGLICIIPNAYFANKMFKHQGARAAKQIVNSFYKGEAMKIVISVFLFTTVFVFYRITPLAFFVSYIVVLMTHWLAPWIIVNKQNRPESD